MPAWVDLAWPDRDGRLRWSTVPADAVTVGAAAIAIDPQRLGWPGIEGPLRPDPTGEVFRSPWDASREVRLCRLLGPDGEPSPACTRSVLERALARATGAGYETVAAAELECFLVDPATGRPVYEAIENYGIVSGTPYESVMRPVRALGACGVPVMATNPEYGGGQFEINLRHGPALKATDGVVLLRPWLAMLAADQGLRRLSRGS